MKKQKKVLKWTIIALVLVIGGIIVSFGTYRFLNNNNKNDSGKPKEKLESKENSIDNEFPKDDDKQEDTNQGSDLDIDNKEDNNQNIPASNQNNLNNNTVNTVENNNDNSIPKDSQQHQSGQNNTNENNNTNMNNNTNVSVPVEPPVQEPPKDNTNTGNSNKEEINYKEVFPTRQECNDVSNNMVSPEIRNTGCMSVANSNGELLGYKLIIYYKDGTSKVYLREQ